MILCLLTSILCPEFLSCVYVMIWNAYMIYVEGIIYLLTGLWSSFQDCFIKVLAEILIHIFYASLFLSIFPCCFFLFFLYSLTTSTLLIVGCRRENSDGTRFSCWTLQRILEGGMLERSNHVLCREHQLAFIYWLTVDLSCIFTSLARLQ